MQYLKKIAGISFALAFLMAIVLFTGFGGQYIGRPMARIFFMIFGALGLVLNLFSFQTGKHGPVFNFSYWIGSLVVFAGLTFQLMHWPYSKILMIAGIVLLGISFFLPESLLKQNGNDSSDLLDEDFS